MADRFTCFSAIAGGKVDRDKGIISGVSVLTEGDAKGHGFKIDSQSISSLFTLAKGFANGVLVKLKHKRSGEFQDVIGETAGSLTNFSVADNKLRADFVLLNALAQPVKDTIYELAEKFFDQFGFSPTANIVLEKKDGNNFARFTKLQSVDLTDEPAANLSLFSAVCEFCGVSGCEKDHDESELSAAWQSGDEPRRLAVESYAVKRNKKLSKETIRTSMSTPTQEAFDALQKTVSDLKAALEAKNTATAITFTGDDGKVVSLSAKDLFAQLATANKAVADANAEKESAERKVVLAAMAAEGRVAFNPDTKVAFTAAELAAVPIDKLKFYAANAPRIPLTAKAIFKGIDVKKKGAEIPEKATPQQRIALALGNAFGGETFAEIKTALTTNAAVEA